MSVAEFPLVETLAERLFIAEHGHTGMRWDQLDHEFGQGDYRRTVSRLLEGLWNSDSPIVVIDQANDALTLRPANCAVVDKLVRELKDHIAIYGDGRATAGDEIGSYVDGYEQGAHDALPS